MMSHLFTPRSRTDQMASLGLALLLAIGVSVKSSARPASAQDGVRGFYETLVATMKGGRTLGESGCYARLAPIVEKIFDLPLMARLAVGPSWTTLSPAQRQQVTDAFGHYVTATYADRFDSYSGEQLLVTGEQPYGAEIIVQTKIVKANGDSVTLNYRMQENGGSWQIADVYLDGTISQLATQRSDFHAILQREGIDGLIMALNRKVDLLTRNLAQSS
jgi:phospholipid transport system substrate-binding protein